MAVLGTGWGAGLGTGQGTGLGTVQGTGLGTGLGKEVYSLVSHTRTEGAPRKPGHPVAGDGGQAAGGRAWSG